MTRRERTEQKMQLLFHSPAAGSEGTDGEFMQLLQGHIFGGLCWTGSLDERMRELVTVTVLSVLSALPQLKAHVGASLNAGCTPLEIREAVYECAPFIGFPKTLNAIGAMNEVFAAQGIALPLPEQGGDPAERYERGLAAQAPLYGDEIKERYAWLPAPFDEAVPKALTEFCFGDYLSRGGRRPAAAVRGRRGALSGMGPGGAEAEAGHGGVYPPGRQALARRGAGQLVLAHRHRPARRRLPRRVARARGRRGLRRRKRRGLKYARCGGIMSPA